MSIVFSILNISIENKYYVQKILSKSKIFKLKKLIFTQKSTAIMLYFMLLIFDQNLLLEHKLS